MIPDGLNVPTGRKCNTSLKQGAMLRAFSGRGYVFAGWDILDLYAYSAANRINLFA
jgi:hypothetical protein